MNFLEAFAGFFLAFIAKDFYDIFFRPRILRVLHLIPGKPEDGGSSKW
jgi:hypothetical protein